MCRRKELRELFQLNTTTNCNTADLSSDFQDITPSLEDVPLLRSIQKGSVSFVYETPKQQEEIKISSICSEAS